MGNDHKEGSHRSRSKSPPPSRYSTTSYRDDNYGGSRMSYNRGEGRRDRHNRDWHGLSREEPSSRQDFKSERKHQTSEHDSRKREEASRSEHKSGAGSLASAPKAIGVSNVDPDDEESIMKAMGFRGFDSTKGRHVPGNTQGVVDKKKKLEYRQYLHKKKLYDVPLTRQQLEERERQAASSNKDEV